MKKDETEEDLSDIERELQKLRPIALSDAFFAAVEARLAAEDAENVSAAGTASAAGTPDDASRGNAVRFGGRALRFPIFRVAASAALLLCAVGIGVWSYTQLGESGGNAAGARYFAGAQSVPASAANLGGNAAGAFSVSSAGTNLLADAAARAASTFAAASQAVRPPRGDFRLVNVERRMNSVARGDVVANADGSLSQDVRYSYTDEYCWEDNSGGAAFIELRPHEELISREMPIY